MTDKIYYVKLFYDNSKDFRAKNIVKAIEWAGCNLERLFGFYKVDKKGIYYSFYDEFFNLQLMAASWYL